MTVSEVVLSFKIKNQNIEFRTLKSYRRRLPTARVDLPCKSYIGLDWYVSSLTLFSAADRSLGRHLVYQYRPANDNRIDLKFEERGVLELHRF